MNSINSLFLSQSYIDAWEDYQRSLTKESFVHWDYVILTASNEQQAEGFNEQIKARLKAGVLPAFTNYAVIPDPDGKRVGSGGATLNVIKHVAEREKSCDFSGLRILVIHSGGDSKRVPQYSAQGKLFSPVPRELPDGRSSTLFDEFIIGMSGVPSRIKSGMLLLSGDVLLLFNSLQIDFSGEGAAAISFKEDVSTGKNHGVFLMGDNGNAAGFLHKQSEETLRACGAVNENNCVDIDTGAVIFSSEIIKSLYSLISSDSYLADSEKFNKYVNETVRLSLYGDFLYPLAENSTLEKFYEEKPEGTYCDELKEARNKVWEALRPYRMKLLRLSPAKFVHFGTTKEVLELMTEKVEGYQYLNWSRKVNSSPTHENVAANSSVISEEAEIGEGSYIEFSQIFAGAKVGKHVVVSHVKLDDEVIPDDTVVHGLRLKDGSYVVRIYGVNDNPKAGLSDGGTLFGEKLTDVLEKTGLKIEDLWKDSDYSLWNAELFVTEKTEKEALKAALEFYNFIKCANSDKSNVQKDKNAYVSKERKSLCSGFNEADNRALTEWEESLTELVKMDRLKFHIKSGGTVGEAKSITDSGKLTEVQKDWLECRLKEADFGEKIRLLYFVGKLTGGKDGDKYLDRCFETIKETVLESTLNGLHMNENCRIEKEVHSVKLPLRVNFAGGWTDTCPQSCLEGGTVFNAAISLNGELPVEVTLRRLDEKKIVFDSRDLDTHGEFDTLSELQKTGDPYDPFALQKAALIACGIIPTAEETDNKKEETSLIDILERLGGGIFMSTEVTGVPKGSGLGTSSILAGACVKALFEFVGIEYTEEDLYDHVLCMEQLMSTGGGWQDQAGGLTPGFKLIRTKPGLYQKLNVKHLEINSDTLDELNERFALIYTGQRRLARNLLRDVVGRYIGNEPDALSALKEMHKLAPLMIFELERDNVDGFANLLGKHWELSKKLDAGSSNTCIDHILNAIEDLTDGRMICGAGGGGFLQVVLKKGVNKKELNTRLKEVFQDSGVEVWESRFV